MWASKLTASLLAASVYTLEHSSEFSRECARDKPAIPHPIIATFSIGCGDGVGAIEKACVVDTTTVERNDIHHIIFCFLRLSFRLTNSRQHDSSPENVDDTTYKI